MEHPSSEDVTIILPDVHQEDMEWLLVFMYTGAVAIPKPRLTSFLQAADSLGIKVLTDMVQNGQLCPNDRVFCVQACPPSLNLQNHASTLHSEEHNLDCNTTRFNGQEIVNSSLSPFPKSVEIKHAGEPKNSCIFKSAVDSARRSPKKEFKTTQENHFIQKNENVFQSTDDQLSREIIHQNDNRGKLNIDKVDSNLDSGKTCNESSLYASVPYNLKKQFNNISPCDKTHFEEDFIGIPNFKNKIPFERKNNGSDVENTSTQCNFALGFAYVPIEQNGVSIETDHQNGGHSLKTAHRRSQQSEFPENHPQRLSRVTHLPKPIPSLKPITNCKYDCEISKELFNENVKMNGIHIPHKHKYAVMNGHDGVSEDRPKVQNSKDNIPTICQALNLARNNQGKCSWIEDRDGFVVDKVSSFRKMSQRVPRLSPIVPPSPWAQCTAPISYRVINAPTYQVDGWMTSPPVLQSAMSSPRISHFTYQEDKLNTPTSASSKVSESLKLYLIQYF